MIRILVWGTGLIAAEVMGNGLGANVQGFIESKKTRDSFYGHTVYGLDDVWPNYDYIVVANMYSDEVYESCIAKGINIDKVIFLRGIKKQLGVANLETLYDVLGEKNYTNYCAEYGLYQESFFAKDSIEYEKKNIREQFQVNRNNLWPVIGEKYAYAGVVGNYFWQDLWAARKVVQSGVKNHFDIGSRLDGFIAHLLSAGIDVTMIDVRKFPTEIEQLHTIVDDATSLRQISDESIESMSALCSLEHFGLGRYGDPINPESCFQCFDNIQKKLKKGGRLYIAVPVGKERVEFNAHRVFYASTIVKCFNSLHLEEFSCTVQGEIEYNVDLHEYDDDTHNGEYRYGLFSFTK